MAHKTLIGGTAYEIGGGKTLIGGTAYEIGGGKTLIGGTAYEVGFAEPVQVTIYIPADKYNSRFKECSFTINGNTYTGGASEVFETIIVPTGSVITYVVQPVSCDCGQYIGSLTVYENNAVKYAGNGAVYNGSFVITKNTTVNIWGNYDWCEADGYDDDGDYCDEPYSNLYMHILENSNALHKVNVQGAYTGTINYTDNLGRSIGYGNSYIQDGMKLTCTVSPALNGVTGTIRHNESVVRSVTSNGNKVTASYEYLVTKDVELIGFVFSSALISIDIFDDPLPYYVTITVMAENNDYAPITVNDETRTGTYTLTIPVGTRINCKVMDWNGSCAVTLGNITVTSGKNTNGIHKSYNYIVKANATIRGYYDTALVGGHIHITET